MAIVKQIGPEYAGHGFVAFIESEPRFTKARGAFGDASSGDTYFVSLHRKPLNGTGVAHCKHRHREIDAAVRCAKRMLRQQGKAI